MKTEQYSEYQHETAVIISAESDQTTAAGRPSRRSLLLGALGDLALFIVVVTAFAVVVVLADRPSLATVERVDRWRFASLPSDHDSALAAWGASQRGIEYFTLARDSARRTLLLRYTQSRRLGPAVPPWDSLGYRMAYLESAQVSPNSSPKPYARHLPADMVILIFGNVALAWVARRRRLAANRRGIRLGPTFVRPLPGWVWRTTGAYAAFVALAAFARWLGMLLGLDTGTHIPAILQALHGAPATSFALAVLAIAVSGPVAEELLFRGVIYGRFAASGYPVCGALVSAFLFAVCHGAPPVRLVQITICGLVTVWLYRRTGSLWPPVLMHGAQNLLFLFHVVH